jgi:hypothetical protein
MSRQIRPLAPFWAAVASVLVLACGGDNLVLPSEGTAASIAATRGNNQSGTVGSALADSLQVRVLDKEGRAVPDQPVTWTVTTGNGSVAPASNKTDANGYAGARWTLGTGAGAQQVVAKPTGNSAPDNLQAVFSATASASAASRFTKVSGDNQTAVAGSALPDSLIVRVSDSDNNPVAGVEVSWIVTGNGAVSSPTTTTGADGRTGVRWTLGAAAGSQGVTATAAPLPSAPVSFSATATVGSAGRLTIVRAPSSAAASGVPFAQQPQVQIQDAGGNPVSLPGITIEAAIASHPGSGTLVGSSTTTTTGAGLATFDGLGIAGPPGDYTLNFSVKNRDDISGTPPSSIITLSAGVASKLTFDVQPSSIAAGGTIAPAVTVRVEDAQGNLVTSATTSVTMAIATNPGTSSLSGTTTVAAIGGIASFADLSLNRPGTGYTLRATASGLTGVTSGSFDVTTGGATTIAANSSTTPSGTVGGPASPLPSVKVTDAQGNGVSGVTVTFAVTQGGGNVSGGTPTTNVQGIATVGSWTLGPTAGSGNNKLTATVTGLSGSPVEFTATATPGSAGKLGFITPPPASGTSGQALNPQPVLQLYDSDNNAVSTPGGTVTATLSQGTGVLTNATAVTLSNGRATFSGLRISGVAGTYKLTFSATDVAGITSDEITIAAGAVAKLSMATQPSATVPNGQVFPAQPIVQLQDADGNPVSQSGVSILAALIGSGGTLSGGSSVSTDANGQAKFSGLKITGDVGNYQILFSSTVTTSTASSVIALTAGPVSVANSSVSPVSGSFTAGDANGFSFTVTAKDQSQNPVPDSLVSLSGFGDGTIDPSSDQTGPNGTASFVFRSTKAGTHQITVTVGGVVLSQKPSVIVSPAAADAVRSSVVLTPTSITQDQQTTVAVTFEDQFGNPLAGQDAVLSVSGNAGTFGDQTPTLDGSGQASTTFTPTSTGPLTISAQLGALTEQADLTVSSAPASGANSSLDVGSPATLTAGDPRQVTVTARNTLNQLMPGAQVSLQMSPATGTTISPSVPQAADGSGIATFTISGTVTGNESISASVAGVAVQQSGALTITPAAPSASMSSITATPNSIEQENPVSVSATFRDEYGNAIPDSTVLLSSDRAGLFGNSSPTTDANGTVTTTFTPDSGSGSPHTLSATLSGVQVTFQLTVTTPAPPPPPTPDAIQSTVAATSPVAVDVPSTVIVTVIGTDGNPMPGVTVTLAETGGGGNVVNPASMTDSNGQTQGSFSASAPGTYTVQATAGGVIINQTASIEVQ